MGLVAGEGAWLGKNNDVRVQGHGMGIGFHGHWISVLHCL